MASNERMQTFLEQYVQEGGSVGELVAAYHTLAGTGKTPLGLNQWVLTDKPRMEEFNEDNRIIDDKLRQLGEKNRVVDETLRGHVDSTVHVEVPLVNNYTQTVIVRKNTHGDLDLYINIYRATTIRAEETFAVLPEQYRPSRAMFVSGMLCVSSPDRFGSGLICIHKNGEIEVASLSDTIFTRLTAGAVLI